jgi:GntR family transcriptional regulator, sialic acid-inducible nan operon repressor
MDKRSAVSGMANAEQAAYLSSRMEKPDHIRPRKLYEQVQDRLLALIREGGLTPGDTLPSERELMAKYEVGRPAIREAMQNLQRMGLVEIRHGGRPRVARPSMDVLMTQLGTSMRHVLTHSESSLAHLKEARIVLESEMARIAAQYRTEEDLVELEALLDCQWSVRNDTDRFMDYDGQFHRRVAAVSGNPIFETVVEAIFNWLRVFHVEQVRKLGLESLTMDEHKVIVKAIALRDPVAASRAMTEHLSRANSLYHLENIDVTRTG